MAEHRTLAGRIVLQAILIAGAALMLFPFLWTIITSITPGAGLSVTPALIPADPSLEAYARLFAERPFLQVVGNSLLLAVVTTAVQLFTSSTAAYAFSRLPFRGRGVIFTVYLATMMIPLQVLIVPLFVEVKTLGLLNTHLGALLPTFASAFGIFLLRQAVNQVPRELDEAATLDGAGHFRIFWSVILPVVRVDIITFILLIFLFSWNAFLWPLVVIQSSENTLVQVAVAQSVSPGALPNWGLTFAGASVASLPLILLFLFLQRLFIPGLARTGLK